MNIFSYRPQRGRANANNKNTIVTTPIFSSHSHTRAAGAGPRNYRGFLHNSNYFNHKSDNFIALAATLAGTLASPGLVLVSRPSHRSAVPQSGFSSAVNSEYFPRPGHRAAEANCISSYFCLCQSE